MAESMQEFTRYDRHFAESSAVYLGKHVVSRHFCRSHLKTKIVKVKVQGKSNTHIIFETVLMLLTDWDETWVVTSYHLLDMSTMMRLPL